MTKIDVIVVTYNSGRDVVAFLDSLDVLEGAELRVLVCDNASGDDTVLLAAAHPRATEIVHTGGNLGYAAAINAGLARVDDDSLVIIANPDIRLHAGFLPPVRRAVTCPSVGVVAPRLLDDVGTSLPSLRRDPKLRHALAEALLGGHRSGRWGQGELVTDPAAYEVEADIEWASGALLVVTPQCRRMVGSWDESFFLYSEETDFQLRTRAAGLRVRYEPTAVASHRGGAAHVDPGLWSLMTRNRVRLFRKYHGRLHTALFGLAVLLNEVLRIPRSATHRRAAKDLLLGFPSLLRR